MTAFWLNVKKQLKQRPFIVRAYRSLRYTIRPMFYALTRFRSDLKAFKALSAVQASPRFKVSAKDSSPCYHEAGEQTFDRPYVFHTAWAARVLERTKPKEHVDISSSLYFVSIISAFVPVRFYDYRPVELGLSGLTSAHADLTALPFGSDSIRSLSCMHVIEHIGLGRYGDPLDYDGDLKAIRELQRVLAKGGDLLFVVPLGNPPRIMFNEQRIYSYAQVCELFKDLTLQEFALIPDFAAEGTLVYAPSQDMLEKQVNACGCFWFKKPE